MPVETSLLLTSFQQEIPLKRENEIKRVKRNILMRKSKLEAPEQSEMNDLGGVMLL